ncbi:hypothetical protein FCV25MIE_13343 [Fagus crenata]
MVLFDHQSPFPESHFQRSSQNPKVLVLIDHDCVPIVQSEAVLLVSQNHVGFEVELVDVGFSIEGYKYNKNWYGSYNVGFLQWIGMC